MSNAWDFFWECDKIIKFVTFYVLANSDCDSEVYSKVEQMRSPVYNGLNFTLEAWSRLLLNKIYSIRDFSSLLKFH